MQITSRGDFAKSQERTVECSFDAAKGVQKQVNAMV